MPALDPQAVSARIGGTAILDVRDEASFRAGHLAGAGHLPRAEFRLRRTELPPREEPLLVVAASAGEARAAAEELNRLGYGRVDWLESPLAELPQGLDDHGPPARLWRPAPFLVEMLPRILAGGGPGPALDLAAGAGREAAFLALSGFEVEALDDDPDILASAAALALRSGTRIGTRVCDLECRDPGLGDERFRLVTVFRFLHRPLFAPIERAIAPGGWLVYETFRRGQRRFGRPTHPRFLLDDGELKSAFPALSVEHYDEPNPAGGPITARLLARKPT